jgi:hypothetical protein
VLSGPYQPDAPEPTFERIRERVIALWGDDSGMRRARWIGRFTDATRQAADYRAGRVLLAGDAAHIHYPVGGQGLNLGLQDAVNLGWKLARVVRGTASEGLLDSYSAERHPVGARVLELTLAQVALRRTDARSTALAAVVTDLLGLDEARTRYAGIMSGLDIRYDLGDGHPLLGRRVPDLDLAVDGGTVRMFELLHEARPVLVTFGGALPAAEPWADRVRLVEARYDGRWELPVLGEVPAPTAVLVRPDGYVGWVGQEGDDGLADALARWVGPRDQ